MARRRRAIGYVRVSTAEQVEGYGLTVQEKAIREFCRAQDFRLIAVIKDEGVSGAAEVRPGLGEVIARLENGGADRVGRASGGDRQLGRAQRRRRRLALRRQE